MMNKSPWFAYSHGCQCPKTSPRYHCRRRPPQQPTRSLGKQPLCVTAEQSSLFFLAMILMLETKARRGLMGQMVL